GEDVYCVARYYGPEIDFNNYSTDPFLDVLYFVLDQLDKVHGQDGYTDVMALEAILRYSLQRADGDLTLASTYIASVFYRDTEFTTINDVLDSLGKDQYKTRGEYNYKSKTPLRF